MTTPATVRHAERRARALAWTDANPPAVRQGPAPSDRRLWAATIALTALLGIGAALNDGRAVADARATATSDTEASPSERP